MTAHPQITARLEPVNSEVVERVSDTLQALLSRTRTASPRELEEAVWAWLLLVGNLVLTALLSRACADATARETSGKPVKLRLDEDYELTQATTLGPVHVPLFAYRDDQGRTRAPARTHVFPLHPHCRSSELLLEWETRLGSQLPFRQAEDALAFFTHGAASVEDNTIARHLGVVGGVLGLEWTCRPQDEVVELLMTRATRDRQTGRPLLYVSSDAHALMRYVDETWKAAPKMVNGLRFWCVDKDTGQTVHLGGDYTFGDCREVARRLRGLVAHLVPTGPAAPQVVFIGDGMPWFEEHLFPVLPDDTVFILDFYHLVKRIAKFAAGHFGANTKRARAWTRRAVRILTGKRAYKKRRSKKRRGHRKNRRRMRRVTVHPSQHPEGSGAEFLDDVVNDLSLPWSDELVRLIEYADAYVRRTDYARYRARGMQIGSGAMESLHRSASQMRLKLAGARWTGARATAVLRTRLMLLAGRWHDFWSQHDLTSTLRDAFAKKPVLAA